MSVAPGSNSPALREFGFEHRHQVAQRALVEQAQLRRMHAHGFEGALDLRGLLAGADHQRAARRQQRVPGEAARRTLEERTAGARQRADLG